MKKTCTNFLVVLAAAVGLCGFTFPAYAQADAGLVSGFLDQAKSAGDSQLGGIASELTGKILTIGAAIGANDAI